MEYSVKDKIEVTENFIEEQIQKSWHEVDVMQQLITNIDISTPIGNRVAEILKNISTNYYVLIGNLEALVENTEQIDINGEEFTELPKDEIMLEKQSEPLDSDIANSDFDILSEPSDDFEPFEYFVDFDDPIGEPITDNDLYTTS